MEEARGAPGAGRAGVFDAGAVGVVLDVHPGGVGAEAGEWVVEGDWGVREALGVGHCRWWVAGKRASTSVFGWFEVRLQIAFRRW